MWLWNRDSKFTKWQHPTVWYVALGWHAIDFAQKSAILEFYIWFPFPHIIAVDMLFCTRLRNFIQIGPPSSEENNLAIANRSLVSCAHNTSRVTQRHWKRNHWIDHTQLTISRVIWRWILSWPWNVGQRSLKVIENSTIWQVGCGFLLAVSLAIWEIFIVR